MQIFVNSVERLNNPAYSAPPFNFIISTILCTMNKFFLQVVTFNTLKYTLHICNRDMFSWFIT